MNRYYIVEYRTAGGIGGVDGTLGDTPTKALAYAPPAEFAVAHRLFIVEVRWFPTDYARLELYRWHPRRGWVALAVQPT